MITFDDLKSKVSSKGGVLVSYNPDWRGKSEFACANKHLFLQRNREVLYNDRWCKECHFQERKRLTEEKLREVVVAKGGKCLFNTYVGIKHKYDFQCKNGHTFNLQANHVVNNGLWCKKCNYQEKMNENHVKLKLLAEERGGSLDSEIVSLVGERYWFVCNVGHRFNLRGIDALAGRWCPDCSKYIKERICRSVMESFYGKPFGSSTPPWLKTKDSKQGLQLDGYNDELKIAFEYNGLQHYQFFELYHKTLANFEKQQERDKVKADLCKENGVTLVVIPEYKARNLSSIADHVKQACIVAGLNVPDTDVDFSKAYLKQDAQRVLVLEELLRKKQGKLLCYKGSVCEVRCERCGNEWNISYSTLINEYSWCARCSGNHKKDLEWVHALAKERGGTCLSDTYVSATAKVIWKCSNILHTPWTATPNAVSCGGTWCPQCALEKLREKAKKQWSEGNLGRYPQKKENNESQ